jgi:hypothetical protein
MTTTPYELLARFATNGTIAGVSVRYLTTINGKVYEGDPQPLASVDEPAFNDFADQFSAAVVAERDELVEQVESLTQAKQAAEASVEQLTAQVATLTNEKATLTQQLAAANARITALLTEVPYDPRVIEASAFINRTTPEEMLQLFGSQDPNVQQIAAMLLAYKANDWRIELDSTEMQQAVGYLQLVGLVSGERAAALLRDGTRAESYVDDGST